MHKILPPAKGVIFTEKKCHKLLTCNFEDISLVVEFL